MRTSMDLLRFFSLLPAGLMLAGCSGEAPAPTISEHAAPIVGGIDDSGTQAHPAVVMLAHQMGLCSGSLIAPNLVLTARHCVAQNLQEAIGCDIYGNSTNGDHTGADFTPSSIEVYTGVYPSWGSPVAVGSKIMHPPGPNACNNDIALIVLNQAIGGITPLAIRLDWGPQIGEATTAVGYGAYNDYQQGAGMRRRRTNVPVVTSGQDWNQLTGAGELAVGQAACSGDSGGPVISLAGSVIGVASRVANCSDPNLRAIYGRLDYHKDLILQAFAAAGATPTLEQGSAPPPITKQPIGGGPCQTGAQCTSALCQTNGGYCSAFCSSASCTSSTMYCDDGQISISGQMIDEKLCYPLPQGTPCEQCRAKDCVNVTSACLGDATCKQLLACVDACSNAACTDDCVAQYSSAGELYESLRSCACNSSCSDVCAHQCGVSTGTGGSAGAGASGGEGGFGAFGGGTGGAPAGSAGVPMTSSGSSGGCSIGRRSGGAWAWLLVALGLLRARRRE